MNRLAFFMRSCTVLVAVAVASCTAPSSVPTPGLSSQAAVIARDRSRERSWMLPEAKGEPLVYVSDQGVWNKTGVFVYSYPDGKQVGFLDPNGYDEVYEGLCSDAHGDVFILSWTTNRQAFIDEFAHGGTRPINSLIVTGIPSGCSVDPTTGNLAIANYIDVAQHGDIAVYADAKGQPQVYYDGSIKYYYYCAYDKKGNLFASGNTNFVNELPRDDTTLRHIYFNHKLTPGSLQWDGSDLLVTALGAKGPTHIDRVTVTGSSAQIVGTTNLDMYGNKGTYLDVEFAIDGSAIAGPGATSAGPTKMLYFWKYPAGGKAFKTIAAPNNSNFQGVAFSAP